MSENAPLLPTTAPATKAEKTYGAFTVYAMTINSIVGSGVLGLPFAFYKAGIAFTWVTFLFFALFSVLSSCWVVEAVYRYKEKFLSHPTTVNTPSSSPSTEDPPPAMSMSMKLTRVTFFELCSKFGGNWMKISCQLALTLLAYGILWAYTVTFASSFRSLVLPLLVGDDIKCGNGPWASSHLSCSLTYLGGVGLFSLVVIPLTLMEIAETKVIQLFLTFYRFAAFGLMLITAVIALIANGGPLRHQPEDHTFWGIRLAGFGTMFAEACYALGVSFVIPDIIRPCLSPGKTVMRAVGFAQTTCLVVYLLLGTICARLFNPPEELAHLNWVSYTGRDGGWGANPAGENALWWAQVLRVVIILFPVLDLPNVFPIVAFSLAGNIEQAIKSISPSMTPRNTKVFRLLCRFIAALPPLVAGAFLGSAAVVFTFAGLFACWLSYNFPPLMQIFGKRVCTKSQGVDPNTTVSGPVRSSNALAWITFAVGAVAWCVSVVLFVLDFTQSQPSSTSETSSSSTLSF